MTPTIQEINVMVSIAIVEWYMPQKSISWKQYEFTKKENTPENLEFFLAIFAFPNLVLRPFSAMEKIRQKDLVAAKNVMLKNCR